MLRYSDEFDKIENLFSGFIDTKKIDESKLQYLDSIIKQSNTDQLHILNNAYLSLEEQTTIFGALRNISQTTLLMKERLISASKIGENPTTAEIAFDLIPFIQNVSIYIDDFFDNKEIYNLEKLEIFSRNLYKKAKKLGFSKDISSQIQEEGLTEPQISGFIEKFSEKVINELDLGEEIGTEDESIN